MISPLLTTHLLDMFTLCLWKPNLKGEPLSGDGKEVVLLRHLAGFIYQGVVGG